MPAIALNLGSPLPSLDKPSLKLVPPLVPSLGEMFRAHATFVARQLRRRGVASGSLDDATQDVFVVAHRHFGKFIAGTSERAWLAAIALRVASDYRRSEKRRNAWPLDLVSQVGQEPSPLDTALRRECLAGANRALAALNEAQRTVFILADVLEMTAPEIAARTDTKLATVYTRLLAARKHFAEALALQPAE